MSRTKMLASRKRINVWILATQYQKLTELENTMGKNKTMLIQEALSTWFYELTKMGVK